MNQELPRQIEFHHGALTPSGGEPKKFALGAILAFFGALILVVVLTFPGKSLYPLGVALGMLALGVLALVHRKVYTFDRERRVLEVSTGLLQLTLYRRRIDFESLTGVTTQVSRESNGVFVLLLRRDGAEEVLERVDDARTATHEANRVAKFCDLPGVSSG